MYRTFCLHHQVSWESSWFFFSKFALLTTSTHSYMNCSDSLFSPRKSTRCVSRKRSTVSIRNSECRRQGISSATRKIKGKWRGRRFLARRRLKTSPEFKQLEQFAPQLCRRYLDQIDVDFNRLRDSEIHQATQLWEALLKPAIVTQSWVIEDDSIMADVNKESADLDLKHSIKAHIPCAYFYQLYAWHDIHSSYPTVCCPPLVRDWD